MARAQQTSRSAVARSLWSPNNTALKGTAAPLGAAIIDFVGYGGADCSEGPKQKQRPTPTLPLPSENPVAAWTLMTIKTDFGIATPMPRNSGSPANDCSTGFRPDITMNDVSVTEGDVGTKTVDFTVTLSAANNTQPVYSRLCDSRRHCDRRRGLSTYQRDSYFQPN